MTSIYPLPPPYSIDHPQQYFPTIQSSTSCDSQTAYFDAYSDAFALLSHQQSSHPTAIHHHPATTNSSVLSNRPTSHPTTPLHPRFGDSIDSRSTGCSANALPPVHERSMYTRPFNSMGGPAIHNNRGIKRQRDHERTPSASTIASNGPASPYMQNGSHPQVANTDTSPNSPAYPTDQSFAKNFSAHTTITNDFITSAFTPDQFGQLSGANSGAHLAMKDFGMQHHLESDYQNDFAPSRQSMSSYDNDSPATPQSGIIDVDMKSQHGLANDVRQVNPNVQFQRTESQAFKDELYIPQNYTSTPAVATKPASQNNFLSPHRNLMAERLQTANLTRSASPTSAISRERSPFRDGSPLAPHREWNPTGAVGTVARMRQEQKDATTQAELARQAPPLHREPTKTISPKDALLDYHENDQGSLFQDSVPVGYETHKSGTEQWPANYHSYGGMSGASQQHINFRHANPVDVGYTGSGFDLQLPQGSDQIQNSPFQANYGAAIPAKMNNQFDSPDFPASMPSMETSASDIGPGLSSQEESGTPAIQRPDDTRANTGTYTCTYHGCTQRFDSHNNLKKHKQEYHLPNQRMASMSPSAEGSVSPRSSGSPAPSGSGMSSAAIVARNSQAGPHKCTRINPSTNKPCNTIFSRPYDLTRHEDTIHNNRKQKVRCQYCREEKTFSRNDALTRHMRVVHPEISEPHGKRGRRAD